MRLTYAIYLETTLDGAAPGFWEEIKSLEFCRHLDCGNFRIREKLLTVEVEQVTDQNRAQGRQVVERLAHRLFLPRLRKLLDRPELDAAAASKFASVCAIECENIPNPSAAHGMAGENPAISCPKCARPMVRRQGGNGPFWGCSNYPTCKGTRGISK